MCSSCNILYLLDIERSIRNGSFLWHLSKTMPLWVRYGILKIMYRILCKTEASRPCWIMISRDQFEMVHFCGICRRQCHYEFNMVFWKSCIIFCAKPKEVDPIELISLRQVCVSIALKYEINISVIKYEHQRYENKQIRAQIIATPSFFIEIIYNRYTVLLAQWYTNMILSPDGVHPQISSSLRFLVLFRHVCLFFQRTHFFHGLLWQMPQHRFQRFDLTLIPPYLDWWQ